MLVVSFMALCPYHHRAHGRGEFDSSAASASSPSSLPSFIVIVIPIDTFRHTSRHRHHCPIHTSVSAWPPAWPHLMFRHSHLHLCRRIHALVSALPSPPSFSYISITIGVIHITTFMHRYQRRRRSCRFHTSVSASSSSSSVPCICARIASTTSMC